MKNQLIFPNPDMNSPWVNEATKQAARAQFAQVRDYEDPNRLEPGIETRSTILRMGKEA